MADIQRSDPNTLILRDEKLHKKNLEISLNEKLNQIKQLEVRIDHLKTVDIKQAEFQRDLLEREIEEIRQKINSITVR